MEENFIVLKNIDASEINYNSYNIEYPYLLKINLSVTSHHNEMFADIDYHSIFDCIQTVTLHSSDTSNPKELSLYSTYMIFKREVDKDAAIPELKKKFQVEIQDLSFCKNMKVLYNGNKMVGYNVAEYDENDNISYSVLYVKEEDKNYYNGELPYLVNVTANNNLSKFAFQKPLKVEHPKAKIKIVAERQELVPTYATNLSSGFDIKANITESVKINLGERVLIPTGLKVAIPPGYELQIRSKSGLALKNGITVLNSPGTVDADYRNSIGIVLINHNKEEFVVEPLMKIAQGVICPVFQAIFEEVDDLNITERKGGFGSTGLF